jgi:hypothetical protein
MGPRLDFVTTIGRLSPIMQKHGFFVGLPSFVAVMPESYPSLAVGGFVDPLADTAATFEHSGLPRNRR